MTSEPDHAWWGMRDAPRDGTVITILVKGAAGVRKHPPFEHEFPYPVIWHGGRWCFARNKAPLFDWQQPLRWKPAART
jgi:hypothetical protein